MCWDTIVQFKIPRLIRSENRTFVGHEAFLGREGSMGLSLTILLAFP
jgi:hypothetical protein